MTSIGDVNGALSTDQLFTAHPSDPPYLLASPHGTLRGSGVEAMVPKVAPWAAGLPQRVRNFFHGASVFGRNDLALVGAVPFAEHRPAHLVVPRELSHGVPVDPSGVFPADERLADARPDTPDVRLSTRAIPSGAEYERCVARVVRRIECGELNWATLSRTWELTAAEPLAVSAPLARLTASASEHPVFALALPGRDEDGSRDSFGPRPQPRRILLGAGSPLWLSRFGTRVRCVVTPGGDEPARDRWIVDRVRDALGPWCRELRAAESEGSVEITGEVRDSGHSALALATAMHPASLRGEPTPSAPAMLDHIEPADLGYCSGLVGWCDSSGQGEWFTVSEGVEIEDNVMRLVATARVTGDADPEQLRAFTARRFREQLAVLGMHVSTPDL